MPKLYTLKARKFARTYRKRRSVFRATGISRNRYTVSARKMHMPLPATMRLTLRGTEKNIVTQATAFGYDSFFYPLYFPGMFKDCTAAPPKFAGGFLQLMEIYNKAYVRAIRVHLRMYSINVGGNTNINVFTTFLGEEQAIELGNISNNDEFEQYSNTWQAKKFYLSNAYGGTNYHSDYRSLDFSKFCGTWPRTNENMIYRTILGKIETPSSAQAITYPCYCITTNNAAGTENQDVGMEFTFDFDIEFSELNPLPQLIGDLITPTWGRRT